MESEGCAGLQQTLTSRQHAAHRVSPWHLYAKLSVEWSASGRRQHSFPGETVPRGGSAQRGQGPETQAHSKGAPPQARAAGPPRQWMQSSHSHGSGAQRLVPKRRRTASERGEVVRSPVQAPLRVDHVLLGDSVLGGAMASAEWERRSADFPGVRVGPERCIRLLQAHSWNGLTVGTLWKRLKGEPQPSR